MERFPTVVQSRFWLFSEATYAAFARVLEG
jgi:hypothetical protein